jgi:hypothetical protein
LLFKALTGKFPKLLVLTLYSLHIPKLAGNKNIMVEWLLSIPKIRFMHVMKMDIFDFFSEYRRPYIGSNIYPDAETEKRAEEESPIVLCPELEAVEILHINADSVIRFVHDRKKLGVPLQTLYIHPYWLEHMTDDVEAAIKKFEKLNFDLDRDFVKVKRPMDLTPEENFIWKQRRE